MLINQDVLELFGLDMPLDEERTTEIIGYARENLGI
ncbi:hypothetical protein CEB3_c21030 [Peptococcaceae bacterium CEB3]|nr:hypothetical protein CEB3_c21030 [Peptococcaceae bacterium CEB3]